MRAGRCVLLLALLPTAVAAQWSDLGMSYVKTKDLTLVYFDSLGYLVPHAVRTFTNSLEWQRRTFGWVPSEPVTILLKDFSDYGNASTWSAPRNSVFFDIAPLSHAFETFPATERMYTLMNHELVHSAQGDVADSEDRRWRRFFHGKVAPQRGGPRDAVVQLSHRSPVQCAALVRRRRRRLHGDLDGRRHRPCPGRLRRDGVPGDGARRCPLLRSVGAHLARHEGRLPDRRECLPVRHAVLHVARVRPFTGEGRRVERGATREARATTPTSSSRSSAFRSTRPGRSGSSSSTSSSGATSMPYASIRSRQSAS